MGIEVLNRQPQALSLDDFDTTFGDYLGAVGGDIAQFNLAAGINRTQQLTDAEQGDRDPLYSARMGMLTGDDRYLRRAEPETPVVDRTTALDRLAAAGLEGRIDVPEAGIRGEALDLLIQWKQAEIKRADQRARAPTSYGFVGVPLEIAGGILDPLNVAASFMPVVGEARWAYMLARGGSRTGAYLKRGLIEGAAGSLAVEPLTLAIQSIQQADYTLLDSVMNVTFGTVLGGGLHVGAGALAGDLRAPKPRPAPTATQAASPPPTPAQRAVAMVEERTDFGPVGRSDLEVIDAKLREARPKTIEEARAVAARELSDEITADATARAAEIAETGTIAGVRAARDKLVAKLDRLNKRAISEQTNIVLARERRARQGNQLPAGLTGKAGITSKQAEARARAAIAEQRADLTARIERLDNAIEANKRGAAAQADLGKLSRGEVPDTYRDRVEARAQQIMGAPIRSELASAIAKVYGAEAVAARASPQVRESALRTAVADHAQGRPVEVQTIFDAAGLTLKRATTADVQAAADANVGKTLFGDPEGAAVATRELEEAPKSATREEALAAVTEDVAEQTRRLDELARNADAGQENPTLAAEMKEAMAEFAEVEAEAAKYGKAARAAAVCLTRVA